MSTLSEHLETLEKIKSHYLHWQRKIIGAELYEDELQVLTFFIGVGEKLNEEKLFLIIKQAWHEIYNAPFDGSSIVINVEKIEKHLAHSILNELGGGER